MTQKYAINSVAKQLNDEFLEQVMVHYYREKDNLHKKLDNLNIPMNLHEYIMFTFAPIYSIYANEITDISQRMLVLQDELTLDQLQDAVSTVAHQFCQIASNEILSQILTITKKLFLQKGVCGNETIRDNHGVSKVT
jgi:hypothetical protein